VRREWVLASDDIEAVWIRHTIIQEDGSEKGWARSRLDRDDLIRHAAEALNLAMMAGASPELIGATLGAHLTDPSELVHALGEVLIARIERTEPGEDEEDDRDPDEGFPEKPGPDATYEEKHALDVACPQCHATAGQRCKTPSSHTSPEPHLDRRRRYQRARAA
jgi:hypothetical protein